MKQKHFSINLRKKLKTAYMAYELEDYSSALSLAYYAMFLVAKVLVLKKGIKTPKTHAGLIHLFNLYYVHESDFSYEKYRYLAGTQAQREDAGYDAFDESMKGLQEKELNKQKNSLKTGKDFYNLIFAIFLN